jgi:hypothetical protein
MGRIPIKLLLFLAVAGFFYLVLLPKRAALVSTLLRKKLSPEDSIHALVVEKILKEICPPQDLCEYKPTGWEAIYRPDNVTSAVNHEFTSDGARRKFLFRIRYGRVTEIIDLR